MKMFEVIKLRNKVKSQSIVASTGIITAIIFLSLTLSFKLNAKSVAAAGNFTTNNGHIYDPDGKEFVPIGDNEFGPLASGNMDFASSANANIYANVWKFNAIRVGVCATSQSCYGQSNGSPVQNSTLTMIDQVVNEYTSRKVVVILASFEFNGCSGFSDQWLYKVHAFNQVLADRYKSNPYVWINILNEPDPVSESQWTNLTETGIQTVRNQGNSNIIVIDGADCSSDHIADSSFNINNSFLYKHASTYSSNYGGNIVADIHTYWLGTTPKG